MRFLYLLTVLCCTILLPVFGYAQDATKNEDPSLRLKFEARFDGELTTFADDDLTGIKPENQTGFVGRYIWLAADGRINDKFSYNFRHRLFLDAGAHKSLFNATDWANVTWHASDKFSVTAGKQMVCIGTIEYDYSPMDVFFASDFWNHISPFQIGVNAGFAPDKNNKFYAQVVNSPFTTKALEGLFAYNLMWYGAPASWLNTIYSVNFMEYSKGDFINYIALGHKIRPAKGFAIDLDYMNRYAGKGTAFFEDFSLHGKVAVDVSPVVTLFAKGGYDVNRAQKAGVDFMYDRCVMPGVDLGFYGAGMEYYPVKKDKYALRFHAFWSSNTANPVPNIFNVGLKWQMKVLER